MPSWKTIAIVQKINHQDSKDSNGVQDQIQGKLRKEIQSIKSFRAQTISHTAAKSLQSCLTLCNPRDGSPPGSTVPGILQARTLEWVAISFSSAWKRKVKVKSLIVSDSQRPHGLLCPWDCPGKSTGVGCIVFSEYRSTQYIKQYQQT